MSYNSFGDKMKVKIFDLEDEKDLENHKVLWVVEVTTWA